MLRVTTTALLLSGLSACGGGPTELVTVESEIATIDGPGLRIANLNIAGLRPDKNWDPATQARVTDQRQINDEFSSWLQTQHGLSAAVGARTAFAFQEVSDNCAYYTSGDNLNVAQAALGPSYAADMSIDPCSGGGASGNAVMTNASILRSESLVIEEPLRSCHQLSVHAMQVRITPTLRPWIVSVHFDLVPSYAYAQFDATLTWIKSLAGSDWSSQPIIILGDFNLVSRGWDEALGDTWASTICEGEPTQTHVSAQDHRDVLSFVEWRAAREGFKQVVGVTDSTTRASGPSFHAWSGKRRVDYAYVRNPPCRKCVFGHLEAPLGETPFYFADHTGLVVTVLPPRQAAQRVARHHLLTQ